MTVDANWGKKVTPVPSVHTPPAKRTGAALPDQSQLEQWGLGFIDGIVEKVVMAIVGVVVPGPLVDQLRNWADVLLPEQIKQPLYDLAEFLVAILGPIPIVGNIAEQLAQYFGLLRDKSDTAQATGEGAQVSADHANVGVARLEGQLGSGGVSGGVFIDDTFDRAGTSIGPAYTLTYVGSGVGTVQINDGKVRWDANGGANRACFVMHNTPLFTEYQAAAVVQDGQFPTITNPTHLRLILRANAALTSFIEARFAREGLSVSKVVGGTRTILGTADGRNTANDRWTFKAGTDDDVRNFIFYCNSDTVINVTDSTGTLSNYGAGYEYAGFLMYADTQFLPPFSFNQVAPPSLQSFTAYDRLPTA